MKPEQIADRMERYLARRAKDKLAFQEHVHSYDFGSGSEAVLFTSDIAAAIAHLRATPQTESCNNCHACMGKGWIPDRMLLCPDCGNKRCPKASDHTLACTDSNEAGQAGSVYTAPQPAAPVAILSLVRYAQVHLTEGSTDKVSGALEQIAALAAPSQPAKPIAQAEHLITIDWPICNPGCDPAMDGVRSKHCICEPAKTSIARQRAEQPANVAAPQDAQELPPLPEYAAQMFPDDLERFKFGEHTADAFSIEVGRVATDGATSVPLFNETQMREYGRLCRTSDRDAIRDAALEEAVEICGFERCASGEMVQCNGGSQYWDGRYDGAEVCATGIRALKSAAGKGEA